MAMFYLFSVCAQCNAILRNRILMLTVQCCFFHRFVRIAQYCTQFGKQFVHFVFLGAHVSAV